MARTYITTNNSRGKEVTAMGPTSAHIRGWNLGVNVQFQVTEDGNDSFVINMTDGSNGAGNVLTLGTVRIHSDGTREWIPANG